jgi:8-oxo-dGTP pyrophosphatase MutT (NUDIX family)
VPAPRRRDSARVIVADHDGCILLLRTVDDVESTSFWITPGGGLDPGEPPRAGALRELAEETGLEAGADLRGPVAIERVTWRFRGEALTGDNWFFFLRTPRFEVRTDGWTPLEREVHHEVRWWHLADLERSDAAVFPSGLAGIARLADRWREGDPLAVLGAPPAPG